MTRPLLSTLLIIAGVSADETYLANTRLMGKSLVGCLVWDAEQAAELKKRYSLDQCSAKLKLWRLKHEDCLEEREKHQIVRPRDVELVDRSLDERITKTYADSSFNACIQAQDLPSDARRCRESIEWQRVQASIVTIDNAWSTQASHPSVDSVWQVRASRDGGPYQLEQSERLSRNQERHGNWMARIIHATNPKIRQTYFRLDERSTVCDLVATIDAGLRQSHSPKTFFLGSRLRLHDLARESPVEMLNAVFSAFSELGGVLVLPYPNSDAGEADLLLEAISSPSVVTVERETVDASFGVDALMPCERTPYWCGQLKSKKCTSDRANSGAAAEASAVVATLQAAVNPRTASAKKAAKAALRCLVDDKGRLSHRRSQFCSGRPGSDLALQCISTSN